MHRVKRGFQNVRLEAKHTRAPLASATVHSALLRRRFALVSFTGRSPAAKCAVHPIHRLLSRYCFLFFTERLYWARLHPRQASDMNTFIVLFFRLLLGTIKNRHYKPIRRFQHCTSLSPQKSLYTLNGHQWRQFRKETASYLFLKWPFTYFLSQHLLSGFIMDRRIPWGKAEGREKH